MYRVIKTTPFILIALLGAACSSTVPKELENARTAYADAKTSPAQEMNPAGLETARQALDRAEVSFNKDGNSPATRTLGYVAERKAELAVAHANLLIEQRNKEQTEKNLLENATDIAADKNRQLKSEQEKLKGTQAALAGTEDALSREKAAREQAEAKYADAMKRLAAIATVKQNPQGVVITLPGGVLFETGKATLIGTAEERLNQVAEALLLDRDATMVIQGHTDNQGNDAINQKLSEDRAASVKDYLIKRGVAPDRISSVGKGSKEPVASNTSPEGRANNRRVEIVVTNRATTK